MSHRTFNWTNEEMITHAQQGIGKVVIAGYRGATDVSIEETVAMATCLLCLGVPPITKDAAQAILKPPHKPVDGDDAL